MVTHSRSTYSATKVFDTQGVGQRVFDYLDPFGYEWEFSQPIAFTHESRSVERTIRMTEAESLFGEEHVRRYRETNGEVGHIWHGSKVLLLTTKGRNSGEPRTTPLAYERVGDNFVVLASNGGAPAHPGWYRNLAKVPQVEVQVKGEVFRAHARTATGGERQRLWTLAARQHPDLNRYQARTEREIPVVVLERTCAAGHDDSRRHKVKRRMVRYRVKPDRAADNEELVSTVDDELLRALVPPVHAKKGDDYE